jgi:gamma-glutamyltranspeptidase
LKNGQPFMALGTPGGDNQEQTILQAFLNIVEFWPDWYPNLHEALNGRGCRRFISMARSGRTIAVSTS